MRDTVNERPGDRPQQESRFRNRRTFTRLRPSLAPRNLGSAVRELLGVIAPFPQGADKNSLNWVFPTAGNTASLFDKLRPFVGVLEQRICHDFRAATVLLLPY